MFNLDPKHQRVIIVDATTPQGQQKMQLLCKKAVEDAKTLGWSDQIFFFDPEQIAGMLQIGNRAGALAQLGLHLMWCVADNGFQGGFVERGAQILDAVRSAKTRVAPIVTDSWVEMVDMILPTQLGVTVISWCGEIGEETVCNVAAEDPVCTPQRKYTHVWKSICRQMVEQLNLAEWIYMACTMPMAAQLQMAAQGNQLDIPLFTRITERATKRLLEILDANPKHKQLVMESLATMNQNEVDPVALFPGIWTYILTAVNMGYPQADELAESILIELADTIKDSEG